MLKIKSKNNFEIVINTNYKKITLVKDAKGMLQTLN